MGGDARNATCRLSLRRLAQAGLAAAGIMIAAPVAADASHERILVLSSHGAEGEILPRILNGLRERLSARPKLQIAVEALDLHDHGDPAHLAAVERVLALKHADGPPDVVIAIQDPALAFALSTRETLLGGAPIVFGEIHDLDPTEVDTLNHATGVLGGHDAGATIEAIAALQPDVTTLLIVDDGAPEAEPLRIDLAEAERRVGAGLAFERPGPLGFAELARRLGTLDPDTAAFLVSLGLDADGRRYDPRTALPRLSRASAVPIYTVYESMAGYGVLGGSLTSFTGLGDILGSLAVQILDGAAADALPIQHMPPHRYVFDYRQLARFALRERDVPAYSVVIEQPDTFYRRYAQYVWTAVAVLIGLLAYIGVLLAALRRRARVQTGLERVIEAARKPAPALEDAARAAEAQAREALSRLSSVAPRLTAVAAWRATDGILRRIVPDGGGLPDPLLLEAAAGRSRYNGRRVLVHLPGDASPATVAEFTAPRPLDAIDRGLLEVSAGAIAADHASRAAAGLAASLRTASDIQAAMLPGDFATLGAVAGVEIHAKLLPAREVGGDLYDVFPLSDGHLCLLVGDVSDKGVPAALLMAMTQTAIRAAAERSVEGGGPPGPSEILAEANRMLCRNNPQAMFVTLFLAIWDASNHRLRYANAGHNPPRRYRTGESWEPLSVQANIALGVLPDQAFGTEETRLDAGEALLLYTDGITEAMNPAGAAYGVRRLDAALAASDRRHPSRVVNNVLADAARFSDGAPQSDDMTCLAMVVA